MMATTTKKGRQLFWRRKVQHPERENPGYAYEKRAPALRWYGAPEWLIQPWRDQQSLCRRVHICQTGLSGRPPRTHAAKACEQLKGQACGPL